MDIEEKTIWTYTTTTNRIIFKPTYAFEIKTISQFFVQNKNTAKISGTPLFKAIFCCGGGGKLKFVRHMLKDFVPTIAERFKNYADPPY